MPVVHLSPGYSVSFDPYVVSMTVFADSRQNYGSCSIDFTNGQSFPFTVEHSGSPASNCIISALKDPQGYVVGFIDTILNDGDYDITISYS